MTRKNALLSSCLVWVFICLAISGLGAWVSTAHIDSWYMALHKPPFNPPAWLFGPVWTTLYIMIGIAGGFIWQKRKQQPTLFRLYCLQLVFNFAWSFIFFGAQSISTALIDIALLWVILLCLLITAFRNNKKSAYLLLPYFLWVSFASILNASLWYLN